MFYNKNINIHIRVKGGNDGRLSYNCNKTKVKYFLKIIFLWTSTINLFVGYENN